MVFVTKDNFTSGTYAVLKDLISNNISDPVSSSAEYRKWIYAREPDTKSRDFSGYPFIIINPVNISFAENKSADESRKIAGISVEIEIVASDKGANNSNGQGLSHIDAITDDFLKLVNSTTGKNNLRQNGLYRAKIETLSSNQYILDEVMCFRRSLLLTFRNWKKVR
ncbi:MAG: hypothetical protein ACTSX6_14695 [Candidatus Heimdallarchaeaceae archaeon]